MHCGIILFTLLKERLNHLINTWRLFLPTPREGNVFIGVCHSVHNWPHGSILVGYSVIVRSVRILLECFLVFYSNSDTRSVILCFYTQVCYVKTL